MKYKLGKTHIAVESEINGFRSRILRILELLTGDENYAIRMASFISTCLKTVRKDAEPLLIKSHIKFHDLRGSDFYLVVSGGVKKIPGGLRSFLPGNVNLRETGKGMKLSIEGKFNREHLEEVKRIYLTKSKLELMSQLQNRNRELKTSLVNLKLAKDLNARMENELEVGREIQMSMLPLNFPSNEHFDLHAKLVPAREVGGDFYDFHLIDDQHLYFVVGDVSGKGVPAALLMAVTKTMIKSSISGGLSTGSIISYVNTELARDNEKCMFITIFMGILNFENGLLRYTNAGHNPTYYAHHGEIMALKSRHGPVVGAIEGIDYGEDELRLAEDSLIFAYTDGVTEAQDENDTLYSDEKLMHLIQSEWREPVTDLIETVIRSVHDHEKNTDQSDDITALALRYHFYRNPNELKIQLQIENRIEMIPQASNSVAGFMVDNGFESEVSKVQIILDEMLSNTIRYGFEDDAAHTICVEAEIQDDTLILTFRDDGFAFNPFELETPDISLGVEEREIGGLGVHIVKSIARDFSYSRKDEQNEIKLTIAKS